MEFFPLALWALDRVLTTPRLAYAAQFAGWFVLQALTCGYLMVFTSLSLVAAVAARPLDWAGARFRRVAPLLLFSGGLATLALTPFLLPYLRVSREEGFTRSLAEVSEFSAHLTDYLATGGRFHFNLWSHRFFVNDALFPGVIASGLVVAALVSGVAWKDPRARMAVAFGLLAFAVSFGPAFPLYEPLCRVFPLMAGIRGAVRFGQLFLAAIAILAGFGWARFQQSERRLVALGILLILGAHLEALRAPIQYRPFEGLSPIFDELKPGKKVIACFPFPHARAIGENVDCMLASTRFWQPILNGNSSFTPELYIREAEALGEFPEGNTLQYLRQLGVTHVIVFTNRLSPPRVAHLDEHPELVLWKVDKAVRIYVLH